MATLTLIGEPFPDREAAAHAEGAVELARAVAAVAPRGCSARILISADRPAPAFASARAVAERLPLKAAMLPVLWRAGVTARPLDGELVHAQTPLVALRSRGEDDGSQSSVLVPHALGWLAPESMGQQLARQYRAFVKRAVKHADVVVTPTHATAAALQERYGHDIAVQVLPLAAPPGYLAPPDADERRARLGVPDRYVVTTAFPGEIGRLEWVLGALENDPSLPPLVVIAGSVPLQQEPDSDAESEESGETAATTSTPATPATTPSPETAGPASDETVAFEAAVPVALRARVHIVRPAELADVGAVLSGAELLALPQSLMGTGYEILGALAAGVPVLHSECAVSAELALDAGVAAESAAGFAAALARLCGDDEERERLGVLAEDRSRGFNWTSTAMALWELHANI